MVAVFGVYDAQVRLHLIQHLLPVVKFGDVVVLAAVVDIPFPGIDGAGLHLRHVGRHVRRTAQIDTGMLIKMLGNIVDMDMGKAHDHNFILILHNHSPPVLQL